jgi:hypothetical protein
MIGDMIQSDGMNLDQELVKRGVELVVSEIRSRERG